MFISAYGSGIESSNESTESFWDEFHEYVGDFCRNESVVVLCLFKCQSGK